MKYVKEASSFEELQRVIDDYMDYYNNERCQYELSKLSPNEYLEYYKTGIYPLKDIVSEDEKTMNKFMKVKDNLEKFEEEIRISSLHRSDRCRDHFFSDSLTETAFLFS